MNGIGDGMGGMNEGMTMTLPYAKSQEPRRNAYVLMGLGKKKKTRLSELLRSRELTPRGVLTTTNQKRRFSRHRQDAFFSSLFHVPFNPKSEANKLAPVDVSHDELKS